MKFVAIILFSTLVSVSGIYILREKVFKLNETAPDNLPFSDSDFYSLSAKDIDGNNINFEKYRGKKLLIVNVASKCGYTNQYRDLQELHKKYNDNVHFLNNIIVRATRYTEQNGFINTLLGRRCRFDLWENKYFHDKRMMSYENAKKTWAWNEMKRAGTYRALNRLIQGSAADQTKKAMVDLWNNHGIVPMIQIHDELNISVADETQVKEIKDTMESAVELHVPVKCEAKIGTNWGEIK